MDRGLAADDDIEVASREPLPQDALAIGKILLFERMGYGLKLRPGQVGEERQSGEGVDQLS